jgi:hypothetical protein
MQSALISKKQEIERELKLGVRDPARKRYLTARLLQIENDIRSMGFSENEIGSNEIAYGGVPGSVSRQYYVPLAE